MTDFKLSAQLEGHDNDVRAVCFPTPDVVLSASRDHTVRLWRRTSAKPPIFDAAITSQGDGWINSLTFLGRSAAYPDGLIVSGGAEGIVEVKKPTSTATENAERLLVGHAGNICALDALPKGTYFVSGSWDGKAIVWSTDKWEMSHHLVHGGDGKSVWAVLAYDENIVITGSADHKIRIFHLRPGGEVQLARTMTTGDVVRALCKLPTGLKGHPSGAQFASAGNDNIIRLWKLNGQEVGTLEGHENYIYSLGCLPTGEIVSSGEDRTLRIWRGSECVQTITHPAVSVWSLAVCHENGDIVSGASDNMLRIFTRSSGRIANPEVLAQFDESVRTFAISGSSRRKVPYNGQEFDFVFDVDIGEVGKPPLKLPYNLSEKPSDSATKFLEDNNLPKSYHGRVVQFITENTTGATIGQTSGAPSAEPYDSQASQASPTQHLEYETLAQFDMDRIMTALERNNRKLAEAGKKDVTMNPDMLKTLKTLLQSLEGATPGKSESASPPYLQESTQLVVRLVPEWPYGDRLPLLDILRLMAPWPGVAPFADRRYGNLVNVALRAALDAREPVGSGETTLSDFIDNKVDEKRVNAGMVMLSLRTVTNLFRTEEGRSLVAQEATGVVSMLGRVVGLVGGRAPIRADKAPVQHNLQIALTTAAFNYAVLAYQERRKSPPEQKIDLGVLAALCEVLETVVREQNDAEVLYRALMALRTILAIGRVARQLAKSMNAEEWTSIAAKKTTDARVTAVAEECLAYLKQGERRVE
ncbi:putative ubiquitin homeostasis protein [Diplogelasinospora grovesii]|uniref:Ubiquitin homeostasis protein n=1 Tax=Diplogelasinospora grovesii TaxID=303347 RepID=A0AAN6NA26_9PEZI|nr:putative ubiquitin homeostasis protein [Diplogelasinospora grovesii]